jgi:glucose/arabinose dehydrogenase
VRVLLVAAVTWHCLAATVSAQLRAEVYVSGLSAPVAFVQDPSNPSTQFVVQQAGRIRAISGGALVASDFLNLSTRISCCGERGLLGLAFPSDYATSGRFYVYFTNPAGDLVVARFKRSANPLIADPNTEFDLRWPDGNRFIRHPTFANHNGGTLAFGTDGYLYVGVGDGGSGNDPSNNAQNPGVLLGKILRIGVNVPDNDPKGYAIPADNPFVDGSPVPALGEIWAFGVRNPWKFTFDKGTGALIIGDVGQNAWEEVDYQPAGQGGSNFGWRNREGSNVNVTGSAPAYQPLTDPIFQYNHNIGAASIIGGYVYRGAALGGAYVGRYVFGDLIGRVWSIGLTIDGANGNATASGLIEHTSELGGASTLGQITAFGEDARGELYVVSYSLGRVIRILRVPSQPGPGTTPLVWQNDDTRQVAAWYLSGPGHTALQTWNWLDVQGQPGWRVAAVADFDRDGVPDLVWQHDSTRQVAIWYMTGPGGALLRRWAWIDVKGQPGWRVIAAADFNRDGVPDLVWQHDATWQVVAWYLGGSGGAILQSWRWLDQNGQPGWRVVAAADVDRSGVPDLVWQNDHTNQVVVWYMGAPGGAARLSWKWIDIQGQPGWHVVAAADFNGDGTPDLIWLNDGSRRAVVWYMGGPAGAALQSWSWLGTIGVPGWSIVS